MCSETQVCFQDIQIQFCSNTASEQRQNRRQCTQTMSSGIYRMSFFCFVS